MGLEIRKAKKLALGMELSKSEAKKAAADEAAKEERKYMAVEAAGIVSSTWKRQKNSQLTINISGAGVAPSSTYVFPPRIALLDLQLERPKNRPWRWRYLNPKQRRQQQMQQQRKKENIWRQRPLGRVENQIRGYQQDMWCKL